MAGTRQILERCNAATNIRKVTGTMETISAVRYRKLYNLWAEGRDFYDTLAQMAYLMVTAEHTIDHPLLAGNDSGVQALVVIGSDRGLCGGYNSNIFRLVDVHMKMAKRFKRKLKIYAKGKKVISHFANTGVEVVEEYGDFDEDDIPQRSKQIGDKFIEDYMTGQIGRLSVVYTRFFSVAARQAQTLTILPVADLIDDLTTRATVIWPWELAFEDFILAPSAEEIFDSLARIMVSTAISGCFVDAALSEHLARVIAMRSATDNASDMISSLTKEYNRARQGQITSELLDIIGGVVS